MSKPSWRRLDVLPEWHVFMQHLRSVYDQLIDTAIEQSELGNSHASTHALGCAAMLKQIEVLPRKLMPDEGGE